MKLIKVLEILSVYIINQDYPVAAEHDILIFNVHYDEIPEYVLKRLKDLGCFYSEEYDNLIMFT